MIPKTEQIQLQRLALHHFLVGNVRDVQRREIGLARDRAQAGKFGTVELDEIVPARVLVIERLQNARIVLERILGSLIAEQRKVLHFFRLAHKKIPFLV